MSGDVLTRWGLVFAVEAELAGDVRSLLTVESVFARARAAYLDRCAVLAAFLGEEAAEVRVAGGQPWSPAATGDLAADGALVGVSVVEVRPSSFDMAVRIRPTGDGDGDGDAEPVNLRRTLVVERTATGERLGIPREVRNEFIALQLAARDFC
ncbi:MAG: hypothetical protein ACYC65_10105 [Candidatus Limnocylindrales bacterium]